MGNKGYDQMLSMLQQYISSNLASSQQLAQQESPYLTQVGKEATGYHDFLKGGDYNAPPAGYGLNMTPLATEERAAELTNAPLGGGTAPSGTQPSGAYALNHADMTDKFAGEYAAQRQGNINTNAASTGNLLLGLGGKEQDRRTQAANNTRDMMGQYFQAVGQKKPGFLSSLLRGGIAAAPSILAAI